MRCIFDPYEPFWGLKIKEKNLKNYHFSSCIL